MACDSVYIAICDVRHSWYKMDQRWFRGKVSAIAAAWTKFQASTLFTIVNRGKTVKLRETLVKILLLLYGRNVISEPQGNLVKC